MFFFSGVQMYECGDVRGNAINNALLLQLFSRVLPRHARTVPRAQHPAHPTPAPVPSASLAPTVTRVSSADGCCVTVNTIGRRLKAF
jgi:hypothetical protein